jgi:hypothetical protein
MRACACSTVIAGVGQNLGLHGGNAITGSEGLEHGQDLVVHFLAAGKGLLRGGSGCRRSDFRHDFLLVDAGGCRRG